MRCMKYEQLNVHVVDGCFSKSLHIKQSFFSFYPALFKFDEQFLLFDYLTVVENCKHEIGQIKKCTYSEVNFL